MSDISIVFAASSSDSADHEERFTASEWKTVKRRIRNLGPNDDGDDDDDDWKNWIGFTFDPTSRLHGLAHPLEWPYDRFHLVRRWLLTGHIPPMSHEDHADWLREMDRWQLLPLLSKDWPWTAAAQYPSDLEQIFAAFRPLAIVGKGQMEGYLTVAENEWAIGHDCIWSGDHSLELKNRIDHYAFDGHRIHHHDFNVPVLRVEHDGVKKWQDRNFIYVACGRRGARRLVGFEMKPFYDPDPIEFAEPAVEPHLVVERPTDWGMTIVRGRPLDDAQDPNIEEYEHQYAYPDYLVLPHSDGFSFCRPPSSSSSSGEYHWWSEIRIPDGWTSEEPRWISVVTLPGERWLAVEREHLHHFQHPHCGIRVTIRFMRGTDPTPFHVIDPHSFLSAEQVNENTERAVIRSIGWTLAHDNESLYLLLEWSFLTSNETVDTERHLLLGRLELGTKSGSFIHLVTGLMPPILNLKIGENYWQSNTYVRYKLRLTPSCVWIIGHCNMLDYIGLYLVPSQATSQLGQLIDLTDRLVPPELRRDEYNHDWVRDHVFPTSVTCLSMTERLLDFDILADDRFLFRYRHFCAVMTHNE